MEERFRTQLSRRSEEGNLRNLLHSKHSCSPSDDASDAAASSARSSRCNLTDFASNDYLGLARCPSQLAKVDAAFRGHVAQLLPPENLHSSSSNGGAGSPPLLGATGSRLLSGDSPLASSLESYLATVHNRPAALLFNSGYDANLSVLGSSLFPGDFAVMDELVHNSLVMGIRMSRLTDNGGGDGGVRTFRHNDVRDLERILAEISSRPSSSGLGRQILIVVESVYSMDGDVAPLGETLDLATTYGASVLVDEAHGLGVYGTTNVGDLRIPEKQDELEEEEVANSTSEQHTGHDACSTCKDESEDDCKPSSGGGTGVLAALGLESHPALLCSVHTFGKAMGCHGAVVASSRTTVEYLINYARPFVYSTAPPPHSLVTIRCAYETMLGTVGEARRKKVFDLVRVFRRAMIDGLSRIGRDDCHGAAALLPSPSPIQAILVPGNQRCVELCGILRNSSSSRRNRRLQGQRKRRFDVYPIRSPTVPKGRERVRIILHSHNSEEEVLDLVEALVEGLSDLDRTGRRIDLGRSKL